MIFSNDFLKILGAWQKGWKEDQAIRLQLADTLKNAASTLPYQFKVVDQPCYRKRFLHHGELFEIIMVDEKDEGLTSWTICQQYAESFKGLQKPGAVSAAIFEHTPTSDEVVLNICELWKSESFICAAEKYKKANGDNADAIFHFKASQGEVILSAPLKGSEIVALTGASSPFDELCDKACIPESERDECFKKLIDHGQYPEILKYTSKEGTQRVIQNTIKILEQKIEEAKQSKARETGA
ncbi:hypothetical protein H4F51_13250 [Pectobacterium brasiliense]|uniref:hypothetical protein n=1 Tax=Pectobacterium brasiliense TaxID=180957 RepID=UPI0015DF37F1|nr:hypothetical protein [Pectobacterium brasiliense]MBA0197655.1 hypothetical protein [Pectobacterium brasiliense]MBN3093526.1 hypothetical protein [Pectobacterium brasiliense]MBN3140881.1 hypothetical protein [Pectobacterium brasiliense]MBW5896630.1 hypothetical protein [Pectobacterium brasiliense]